ncbi:hypothetical protein H311_01575 [Anncaliia algerae PRA109]|nr:hypothetical protein H311_01575 [Anncaliia algerae PRA109]
MKLEDFGRSVEIDEITMKYKVKSHRGRSPSNMTDSLCLIEFNEKITKCL